MMLAEFASVVVCLLALCAGYALGIRHEREAQREAAERAIRTAREESDRTPGLPTGPRSEMATIRKPKWRR